jgi:hypothetical protein
MPPGTDSQVLEKVSGWFPLKPLGLEVLRVQTWPFSLVVLCLECYSRSLFHARFWRIQHHVNEMAVRRPEASVMNETWPTINALPPAKLDFRPFHASNRTNKATHAAGKL